MPGRTARVGKLTTHICYCHGPFRYAWSQRAELSSSRPVLAAAIAPIMHLVRRRDRAVSRRVDAYVANSRITQQRIAAAYHRHSEIIHAPIDVDRFRVAPKVGDYYLVVSALVPYKRVDLAIEACNRLREPLLIVGTGPEESRLKSLAGPTVKFLGSTADEDVVDLYSRCRALLFPGLEDYGLTPLEAMASGRPVIAFGAGGALDTVADGLTGRFFYRQTSEALIEAINACERTLFRPAAIREHAQRFGIPEFRARFCSFVSQCIEQKRSASKAASWYVCA